jgi:hypothetical protein
VIIDQEDPYGFHAAVLPPPMGGRTITCVISDLRHSLPRD